VILQSIAVITIHVVVFLFRLFI